MRRFGAAFWWFESERLVIVAGLGSKRGAGEGVSEGVTWVIEGYGLVWSTWSRGLGDCEVLACGMSRGDG